MALTKYEKSEHKGGTIAGIIFFPQLVIWAYRQNIYTLAGHAMTGGRYYWRSLGWSILTSILPVGWIYGFVKLSDIVNTRNRLAEKLEQIKE
ncbi:MAG: hypothetical protein LBI43_06310 [Streptococcaceae bacterium]|jgi:hypothetical protein|nr:hypothetical protein [Streptococcaceae bacterium]